MKSSEIAVRGPDLDAPGPFNNTETDGVSNVHQIHFHVDSGTSAALTPRREIQRSAWRGKGQERQYPPSHPLPPGRAGPPATGGFGGVLVGRDGPRSNEVRRPSRDLLSVADAPGTEGLDADDCPFIYRAHFSVTVADPEGVDVARAKYDVRIEKRTPTEVPNTENAITPVEKLDLVRRRSLP